MKITFLPKISKNGTDVTVFPELTLDKVESVESNISCDWLLGMGSL